MEPDAIDYAIFWTLFIIISSPLWLPILFTIAMFVYYGLEDLKDIRQEKIDEGKAAEAPTTQEINKPQTDQEPEKASFSLKYVSLLFWFSAMELWLLSPALVAWMYGWMLGVALLGINLIIVKLLPQEPGDRSSKGYRTWRIWTNSIGSVLLLGFIALVVLKFGWEWGLAVGAANLLAFLIDKARPDEPQTNDQNADPSAELLRAE